MAESSATLNRHYMNYIQTHVHFVFSSQAFSVFARARVCVCVCPRSRGYLETHKDMQQPVICNRNLYQVFIYFFQVSQQCIDCPVRALQSLELVKREDLSGRRLGETALDLEDACCSS